MSEKQTSVIVLDTPVKRGDTLITEITITRPQSGAYRGISFVDLLNMQYDALLKVLPRVSTPTLTENELANSVDAADLIQMGGALISFLVPKSTQMVSQTD